MTNTDTIISDVLEAAEELGDRELEALCYRALGESDPGNVLPERELATLVLADVTVEDARVEVLDWAADCRASRGWA